MSTLKGHEIGGGIVRRKFKLGTDVVVPGTVLTADQLQAMPVANRNALIETKFIDVWPSQALLDAGAARAVDATPTPNPDQDLAPWMVPVDGGFDVLMARKVNAEPLSKKDARKLAETLGTRSTATH